MALKDLSTTKFPQDFFILIYQLSDYIKDVGSSSAGTKPPSNKSTTVSISVNNAGEQAGVLLISFWRSNIVPLDPTVSVKGTGTFDLKYKDVATWNNYFFILRTQLLGAVGGNSNDPLVKSMDAVWAQILLIKGTWKVTNVKNSSRSIR